jgi:hypothetical protein
MKWRRPICEFYQANATSDLGRGMLGGKVALLVLRDRHQSGERIVFLHTHILNLFEEL